MISPSLELSEALRRLRPTREGQLIVEWLTASLADRRAACESPGNKDRDFHAGAASEINEVLKAFRGAG